jgi:nucleoside-diphosphate-sugar epimerase
MTDGLDYSLFRPFNFIGPNLDSIDEPKEGSSRVFTQFLSNVFHGRPSSSSTAVRRSGRSRISTTASTA